MGTPTVELNTIVAHSIRDTMASLWPWFGPELILCGTILVMLIVRLFHWGSRFHPFILALAGSLLALYCAVLPFSDGTYQVHQRYELFTGMLVFDAFSIYVRALLLFFVLLFALFTRLSGVPSREEGIDFYCLVFGATLGMCLMASANHLLIVFMAIEIASVPSYVLAGMLKGQRLSSEAALKYSVYGAGAAGVMLYGISLLAGVLGSVHLPTVAVRLAEQLPELGDSEKLVLALAGLMITVGLAFKLSAVPFHFWCPDVFEGAAAEIGAFLSVASKAAALALVVRMVLGLGLIAPPTSAPPAHSSAPQSAALTATPLLAAGESATGESEVGVSQRERFAEPIQAQATLSPARAYMALLLAFMAAVTCTFGNLAAYGQTNIKRLLAYSTIAHAGYMLLPLPAALTLVGYDTTAAQAAVASLALYMGIYLFMNLGAFAIVALLRNELGSEQIEDYAGLVKRHPVLVVCMAIIMFSLVGVPPFAGFVAKFAIFATLMDGYRITGQAYLMLLLIIGGLNTVLSLFYYLRVVKVMTIDPEPEQVAAPRWSMISLGGAFVVLITLPIVLLFLNWDGLQDWSVQATQSLF
jgi:NADH-quinone oxidoreductase subunit N